MFSSLRDRLSHRRGEDRLPGVALVSDPAEPTDLFSGDPVLASLADELGELGRIDLAAAPRERTWAVVRAEVAHQETRGAYGRADATPGRRFGRLALGGAAVIVAATLGVVGLTDAFRGSDQVASSSTSGSVLAGGGSTTDTQAPDTTSTSLEPSTSTSLEPTDTMVPPTSTVPSSPGSTDTTTHGGSGPTVPSTSPKTHTSTTTAPATTSTSAAPMMAAAEREKRATTVAESLANKLITGSPGAETLVTDSATRGLVQMRAALNQPFSYKVIGSTHTASGARVVLEIYDRVPDPDGDELIEVQRRFALEMRVDGDHSLLITRIYAAH